MPSESAVGSAFWAEWDVVLALIASEDDGVLPLVEAAVRRGGRVVAFAERADAVRAASRAGCEVVGDFASSIYRTAWVSR